MKRTEELEATYKASEDINKGTLEKKKKKSKSALGEILSNDKKRKISATLQVVGNVSTHSFTM